MSRGRTPAPGSMHGIFSSIHHGSVIPPASGWVQSLTSSDYDLRQPDSLQLRCRMTVHRAVSICLILTVVACTRDQSQPETETPVTTVRVHTTQRSAFQIVGADTLSDSARVLEIHPEQDGDGLVAVFTDPGRRVSAGLAIIDRRMAAPQLLWPDSVTAVWWTGPHTLAFTTTTGTGIRLVVDVHAPELRIADTSATSLTRPPTEAVTDSAMMQRARIYTDSVRGQVDGAPQASALTYAVTRLVQSRDGRLGAFHTAARGTGGALTNPAWYAIDRETGTVRAIDQVTGPITELPSSAGQWNEAGSFFYAKGHTVWEAEVARESAAGTPRTP